MEHSQQILEREISYFLGQCLLQLWMLCTCCKEAKAVLIEKFKYSLSGQGVLGETLQCHMDVSNSLKASVQCLSSDLCLSPETFIQFTAAQSNSGSFFQAGSTRKD